jgi:tRNA(fMet)-specific endonuclease VapC
VAVRIALDSNRYTDFARGLPEVVERLRHVERIFVPFIVVAELRAGFLLGTRTESNERGLTAFLSSPRVEVLWADEGTTHQYARLFMQLRKQGTPIPTNDIWIAALIAQHDLLLFARDSHFDRLPQLARI